MGAGNVMDTFLFHVLILMERMQIIMVFLKKKKRVKVVHILGILG